MSPRTFFRLFAHMQMMPILESGEETLVGGQAVMEGVMMRAPHSYCVAVRKATGEVVTEDLPLSRMSERYPIFRYPVMRGLGTLYQALKLGGRALRFSANAALDNPELQKAGQPAPKEMPAWSLAMPVIFSVGFFLFAYKFLPLLIVTKLAHLYPVLNNRFAFNTVDGVVRLLILLGVLYTVSRNKEIRRVFQYHGAEHKVVFNFESGQPVTVENAQRFSTFHPRCGTSFLFVVFLISIPIYALVPWQGFAAKLLARIVLLLPIAGLSYELIRFAAKRPGGLMAVLTAPGLWTQRITTKPPSDDQAAVAIQALEGAMTLEKAQGGQLVIA
ncbi:MAG TPA: DUF1385 domain-containing protein [Bryobacteraceae bacterium]|nr:DUF1385 domain-containing protein [Bryobacteraceae bacterium]